MAGSVEADSARSSLSPVPCSIGQPIVDVRCRVFRSEARGGVAMSFARLLHRTMFVVEVELADGSIGVGESWTNYPDWAWIERVATIGQGVAPLLVGTSPRRADLTQRELLGKLLPLGRQWGACGPIYQAVSAVDIALWDLAAQKSSLSLCRLLGGPVESELIAYGSSLGPTDVAETAERCAAMGLRAAKVKVGFGRDLDLKNVRTARSVLGESARLFADANQGWSVGEALEMLRALGDLGIEWVEEPVAGNSIKDLECLASQTGIKLVTGENLAGASEFDMYIASPGVSFIQPDLTKAGGVTEYLEIARLADKFGKAVNPHLYAGAIATVATIQVAAAIGRTELIEWDVRPNPMHEMIRGLLTPRGTVPVPDGVGLGLPIVLDELSEYEVRLDD